MPTQPAADLVELAGQASRIIKQAAERFETPADKFGTPGDRFDADGLRKDSRELAELQRQASRIVREAELARGPPDLLLTRAEVLQTLKISRTSLRNLIQADLIHPIRLNQRLTRYRADEVHELVRKAGYQPLRVKGLRGHEEPAESLKRGL